ncbi:MAG: RNHCP domain-containing protein, partial [Chlamydiae bacterium]|nr:RNHCP domain-containing protein [Chlamydiota bacterium]
GYRNHCPFCLSSLHVDETKPGDRKSHCLGIMEAKQVRWHTKKGWQIVHQCKKCGVMKANKIVDHGIQPDNINKMIQLMRR